MFKLVTDNMADLPREYLREHNVDFMALSYILDGEEYGKERELDYKDFYGMMRNGKMPTTSHVIPEEAKAMFAECIKENDKI